MAESTGGRVLRGPCRIIFGPVGDLSAVAFPYGGVQVGKAKQLRLVRNAAQLPIWHEGSGLVGDVLEGGARYSLSFFLRGWDDDAIGQVFGTARKTTGAQTGHSVLSFPGDIVAGASATSRARRLLVVPDDIVNVPALIVYRAVPEMPEGAEMLWQRNEELGIPMMFECMADDSGRIAQIGRLQDLDNS